MKYLKFPKHFTSNQKKRFKKAWGEAKILADEHEIDISEIKSVTFDDDFFLKGELTKYIELTKTMYLSRKALKVNPTFLIFHEMVHAHDLMHDTSFSDPWEGDIFLTSIAQEMWMEYHADKLSYTQRDVRDEKAHEVTRLGWVYKVLMTTPTLPTPEDENVFAGALEAMARLIGSGSAFFEFIKDSTKPEVLAWIPVLIRVETLLAEIPTDERTIRSYAALAAFLGEIDTYPQAT